jgi:hypothetical protein
VPEHALVPESEDQGAARTVVVTSASVLPPRHARALLATFVAHTEATYAAPLLRYVTDAFERYLACGDFSRGKCLAVWEDEDRPA